MTPRDLFNDDADLGQQFDATPAVVGEIRYEWRKGRRLIIGSVMTSPPIAMISLSYRNKPISDADQEELLTLARPLAWRRVAGRTFAAHLEEI